ncbi:aminotransferase class V-fold PLP-dependent enzyme [Bosea sp. 685]|uniref:aminotransferase class V-fold PLP-dependent enzyme n=1 Tax=Bosea sp. 685 TaxID=3080057 RepID=UPI0028930223|nr:aminotransferase class V-fold PLP-dependent enzyme [Bosea sp. 685]WNJ93109.1 aminotransferase class V-fold PLP-dependent enzyme [Bosea sp. 685]
MLHLNAAGAGLPPAIVTETIVNHLRREAEMGPHWAASEARERLNAVRSSASALLGCRARNIAFGPSAGRLWAMALLSRPVTAGARILVARSEWASNILNLLKLRRDCGVVIEIMPMDEAGLIDVARTAALIDDRTIAVCLPVVSSGYGLRQPVAAIAALPRPAGCLLFVDAAQAVGQLSIGLDGTEIDVLVTPGRKWLRGPRGEAMMALSERALRQLGDPPLLDQTGSPWTDAWTYRSLDDARRFETYEFSAASRLGLGAAIDHALAQGIADIREGIGARLAHLHEGLSTLPGIQLFEPLDAEPLFLTFVADSLPPGELNQRLAQAGIAAAIVDRAYARLDFEARGLAAVNRVAPHMYSREAGLDQFLKTMETICSRPAR